MPKSKKNSANPMRGFRPQGVFVFEGKPVQLLINPKSGELLFEMEGTIVEDHTLQNTLMDAFQSANRKPPEKS